MITLKKLKEMKPETVFTKGVVEDSENGINMNRTGRLLKRVAKRGGYHDWCIYVGYDDENTYEQVERVGDKIISDYNIKKLVECDDEAFKMYNY